MSKVLLISFLILASYAFALDLTPHPTSSSANDNSCAVNDPRPICNMGQADKEREQIETCIAAGNQPVACWEFVTGKKMGEAVPENQHTADSYFEEDDTQDKPKSKPKKVDYLALCETAHTQAENSCKRVQQTGLSSQLLSQFSQVKAAGNIKEACGLAKQISALSIGANAGFGFQCQRMANECVRKCDPKGMRNPSAFRPYKGECEELKSNATTGYLQAGADVGNFALSAQCEKAADTKCVGQNALSDPDCAQFCSQPGRVSHPRCALATANCQNPTFVQQNAQFCQCLQNPFAPNCSTAVNPIPREQGNDPLAGLRPNPNDLDVSDEEDFTGNTPTGNFGAGANGTQGGSGFNGGGSGSAPIAGDSSVNGNGNEPLDKDILTGQSGGGSSAGGFFGYGGSAASDSTSESQKNGNESSGSEIDLRAFLPGGKNDPRREPASAEETTGITKSDGLTNFQKVTRKINEKLIEGALNP